jgi:hypothetical protein
VINGDVLASHTSSETAAGELASVLEPFWGSKGNEYFLHGSLGGHSSMDIKDWNVYREKRLRGVHKDDVTQKFPLILDQVLTVYQAISEYLDRTHAVRGARGTVNVVIAGAEEKETLHWPTFLELLNLLPGMSMNLTIMGPELPASFHDFDLSVKMASKRSKIRIHMISGYCQDHVSRVAQAQAICALNAGLAAYYSWRDGLEAIMSSGFTGVFLFTDYVAESMHLGVEVLRQAVASCSGAHAEIGSIFVNPFRKPDACVVPCGHNMPYCSGNAFGCFVHFSQ